MIAQFNISMGGVDLVIACSASNECPARPTKPDESIRKSGTVHFPEMVDSQALLGAVCVGVTVKCMCYIRGAKSSSVSSNNTNAFSGVINNWYFVKQKVH